jgi:hypothetical protein
MSLQHIKFMLINKSLDVIVLIILTFKMHHVNVFLINYDCNLKSY